MVWLSVIIVTFNSCHVIQECLDSIYKHNDIGNRLEIIVVDNSNDSEPIHKILKEKFNNVIFLINTQNGGYGQGNNLGAKVAKGEYLLFANPDIILIEPVFSNIVAEFQSNQDLHVCGVKHLTTDQHRGLSFFFRSEYYGLFFNFLTRMLNWLDIFLQNRMVISGAFLFVRKAVFFRAGLFDEEIFLFCEEADIITRMRKIEPAFKMEYFSNYKIIHLEGGSTELTSRSVESNLFRFNIRHQSKKQYFKKNQFDFSKLIENELRAQKIKRLVYTLMLRSENVKLSAKYIERLVAMKVELTTKTSLHN